MNLGPWLGPNEAHSCPSLDWVIIGGETGPGARPMHPGWVRSLRDQCRAAGVPFFFKSWGAYLPRPQVQQAAEEAGDPMYLQHGPDAKRWRGAEAPARFRYARPDGAFNADLRDGCGRDEVSMIRNPKYGNRRFLDGRTWDEMPASVRGAKGETREG